MNSTILVTGATGNVGSEVVKQLATAEVPIKVLVRNPEKASSLKSSSVEVVNGDLGRPETLEAAMKGIEKLLLISSPDPNQVQLQSNAIQAARRANVRHVVKLSAMGADVNSPVSFGRWHGETELQLRESGLDFTFLRPNFFMQNLLMSAGSIGRQGTFYGSMKDGKASFVDIRDVASVAVGALTGSGHEGKIYEITGPEALSFADIGAKLSGALGRKVSYVDLPRADFIQGMTTAGVPDWMAEGIAGLYEAGAAGHMSKLTDVVATVGGRKPTTFDRFAQDFVSSFTH